MATVHTGSGMKALGRLFATGTATALAEAELLERFVSQGDSAGFEVLLERHGPMVLGVCRRILDDPNDVDDAFQATFLILVKKAASIRERAALGTWLYGVARRVAVRARVNARRRSSHERSDAAALAMEPLRASPEEDRELRVLIEAELERLPYRYRDPMVLCDLEGQTHEQAAAQLRCPVGTVKSRLSRGRERLRARLVRRGVAPAAALTSLLAAETTSAVPVALLKPTFVAAAQLVAGRALAAGARSARLTSLVEGVTRSMIASMLKIAAGAALALALTLGGVLTFVPSSPARQDLVRESPRPQVPAKTTAAEKPVRPAEPGSERFVLENGLTVILRPIKGTESTALVVLYSIGNDHDPAAKSGAGHLLEHMYVTAAAGSTKVRTADEFAQRYADGANGQTGDRYTVFATVFPKAELETELKDAAARMGDLRLDAHDLERERPRLLEEVANMFGDFPMLGALNHARELVRPTSGGGRRGGLPAHVNAVTIEELQARWKHYYKPRNATLVLSGAVDAAAVRKLIAAHFGPLPTGDDLPPPREPAQAKGGQVTELKVRSRFPEAESTACLAYAAPQPGSELYAPFLLLVARLWADAGKLGDAGPTGSPVYFTPLDDGAVVAVSTAAKPGESAAAAFARIESFVAKSIGPGELEPELKKFERMTARQQFGFLLGLVDLSDNMLVGNPYGVAFSLGRRDQLKVSPAELRRAWDAITDDQLRRAAREIFAPVRHSGAFIRVDK